MTDIVSLHQSSRPPVLSRDVVSVRVPPGRLLCITHPTLRSALRLQLRGFGAQQRYLLFRQVVKYGLSPQRPADSPRLRRGRSSVGAQQWWWSGSSVKIQSFLLSVSPGSHKDIFFGGGGGLLSGPRFSSFSSILPVAVGAKYDLQYET